ncbi:aminomethyl-transferring glycine dehydrogenase subunit GcvPA [Thermosyntropha sp.]|uniref:aminomethyl-transferring glycine dehydrogenase subunit GcvPA n=1 Tax=Thermosyntropha sp. TaxID=2740820 RepID=UPI0025FF9EE7|nr:aminomethyl-transferring glycine dehydrogenase subunit GcvPA [Thermosyntropha sp.]MBO8159832.1 aminomethyl-transferring glycine dehydrogenase subunit GcvPA [Thermosyntropha sp.]
MRYTPNPPAVAEEMLKSIGLNSFEDLFADIPQEVRLNRELDLPEGLSEIEVKRHLLEKARRNITVDEYPCFLGAGAYDHFVPAAVDQILLRSEFYTAYTPYQPEISQGILQSIFEYQTMICKLTGLDVSNASMYDGGTALAEACQVAVSSKAKKIIVPDNIHPENLRILKTYALSGRFAIEVIPGKDGIIDIEAMKKAIGKGTAAVVIQQPNFYGIIEQGIEELAEAVHQNKGLLIMSVDPISLAILKSPAEYGADIAVGDGQVLGNNLSFGGPYLGFFAASEKLLRKIPGRIVGQSVDSEGKKAFVLTLQAREQHIRREKASSNICSNQALCALAAAIYLSLIGPEGLRQIALRSHQMAVYAKNELEKKGLTLKYKQPFFREFAVKMDNPSTMNKKLLENGIIGGFELDDAMMLAFTEKRTRAEIDKLVNVLGGEK